MIVARWIIAAMLAGAVAFTLYYSPSRVLARARKRGVYIPRQDFEWDARRISRRKSQGGSK